MDIVYYFDIFVVFKSIIIKKYFKLIYKLACILRINIKQVETDLRNNLSINILKLYLRNLEIYNG